MPSPLRRLASLLSVLALAGALPAAALLDAAPTPVEESIEPAFASTCIGYCKHPTNAAKVFRWGVEEWRQEFETGELGTNWQTDSRHDLSQQNGMLTIIVGRRAGTVTVHPDDQSAKYGRWETRMRAVELESENQSYEFNWELVPVGDYRCGANSIVMGSYRPDDTEVRGAVRSAPDTEFRFSRELDLRSRAWHTYAVEVTPESISWFVDTEVIHTERRSEARSGVRFHPQFRLVGDQDGMNRSWLQMDWVRYYTLDRPHAQSIEAPRMDKETYADAC